MVIEQTIEIPESRRLAIDVPHEVPAGRVMLTFSSASCSEDMRRMVADLKRSELPRPRTIEEAIQQAEQEAAKPDRTPISSCFGIMKDSPLAQSGAEYQRSIRDEWD